MLEVLEGLVGGSLATVLPLIHDLRDLTEATAEDLARYGIPPVPRTTTPTVPGETLRESLDRVFGTESPLYSVLYTIDDWDELADPEYRSDLPGLIQNAPVLHQRRFWHWYETHTAQEPVGQEPVQEPEPVQPPPVLDAPVAAAQEEEEEEEDFEKEEVVPPSTSGNSETEDNEDLDDEYMTSDAELAQRFAKEEPRRQLRPSSRLRRKRSGSESSSDEQLVPIWTLDEVYEKMPSELRGGSIDDFKKWAAPMIEKLKLKTRVTRTNVVHGYGTVATVPLEDGDIIKDPTAMLWSMNHINCGSWDDTDFYIAVGSEFAWILRDPKDRKSSFSYFMNEARDGAQPNVKWTRTYDPKCLGWRVLRPIRPGEELLADYGVGTATSDDDDDLTPTVTVPPLCEKDDHVVVDEALTTEEATITEVTVGTADDATGSEEGEVVVKAESPRGVLSKRLSSSTEQVSPRGSLKRLSSSEQKPEVKPVSELTVETAVASMQRIKNASKRSTVQEVKANISPRNITTIVKVKPELKRSVVEKKPVMETKPMMIEGDPVPAPLNDLITVCISTVKSSNEHRRLNDETTVDKKVQAYLDAYQDQMLAMTEARGLSAFASRVRTDFGQAIQNAQFGDDQGDFLTASHIFCKMIYRCAASKFPEYSTDCREQETWTSFFLTSIDSVGRALTTRTDGKRNDDVARFLKTLKDIKNHFKNNPTAIKEFKLVSVKWDDMLKPPQVLKPIVPQVLQPAVPLRPKTKETPKKRSRSPELPQTKTSFRRSVDRKTFKDYALTMVIPQKKIDCDRLKEECGLRELVVLQDRYAVIIGGRGQVKTCAGMIMDRDPYEVLVPSNLILDKKLGNRWRRSNLELSSVRVKDIGLPLDWKHIAIKVAASDLYPVLDCLDHGYPINEAKILHFSAQVKARATSSGQQQRYRQSTTSSRPQSSTSSSSRVPPQRSTPSSSSSRPYPPSSSSSRIPPPVDPRPAKKQKKPDLAALL